jgi:hypothetical protein
VGKSSFSQEQLAENYAAALEEVLRLKPASSKGRYIHKVHGVDVDGPGHSGGPRPHAQRRLARRGLSSIATTTSTPPRPLAGGALPYPRPGRPPA